MKENDVLEWLQNWYFRQCDNLWEHGYGVSIDTIDNPGWTVKIDLKDTSMDGKGFEMMKIDRADDDWIIYWSKDSIFEASGGPRNLIEILSIFRAWVENNTN